MMGKVLKFCHENIVRTLVNMFHCHSRKNKVPKRIKPTMIKAGCKNSASPIKPSLVFSDKKEAFEEMSLSSEMSSRDAFSSVLSEQSSTSLAEERELLR